MMLKSKLERERERERERRGWNLLERVRLHLKNPLSTRWLELYVKSLYLDWKMKQKCWKCLLHI